MTDTDNEIIKALECMLGLYRNDELIDCCGCAFETDGLRCENCSDGILKASLDLIKRQKAEIEEQQSVITVLKQSNINLQELYQNQKEKLANAKQKIIEIAKALQISKAEIERFADIGKMYSEIRKEAIKEFIKQLKDNSFYCDMSFGYGKENYEEAVSMIEVERIANEMVGEENDI